MIDNQTINRLSEKINELLPPGLQQVKADFDALTSEGMLGAMGQAFFTLSVGMGAMLTYGSYLRKNDDIVGASVAHHLIERGWDDIVGIDKSAVPTDIGSTSHASGSAGVEGRKRRSPKAISARWAWTGSA